MDMYDVSDTNNAQSNLNNYQTHFNPNNRLYIEDMVDEKESSQARPRSNSRRSRCKSSHKNLNDSQNVQTYLFVDG